MSVQPVPQAAGSAAAAAASAANAVAAGATSDADPAAAAPAPVRRTSVVAPDCPEILSGWLMKKGVLGYQARFFALYENGELQFFSGDEVVPKQKLKGKINLLSDSRIRHPNGTGQEFPFDIICGGKALSVAANKKEDYDNWHKHVMEVIKHVQSLQGPSADPEATVSVATTVEDNETFKVQEIMGTTFHYEPRYSDLRPIGQGAYGMVVQAHDSQDGQKVAIKKSKEVFNNVHDAKRVVREIRLLRVMQHPNIIRLKDMFIPNARHKFTDIYLVLELMDTNLHRVIYSPQDLSEDHKKYVLFQVLCGLKFLHSAGVIHRDLKPSNVLINADCKVRICDFGLSREVEKEDNNNIGGDKENTTSGSPGAGAQSQDAQMTEYVITRWYRAPEVMLVSGRYGTAVDMWSVGCIYAEMCRRKALFKGRDYVDQLTRIFRVLGKPTEEGISFVKKQRARDFVMNLPDSSQPMNIPDVCRPRNIPWEEAKHVPVDPDGMDMLEKILVLNPAERLTVQQALDHAYLFELQDDEPQIPELEGVDLSTLVDMTDIETMELTRTNLRRAAVKELDLVRSGWVGHRCRQLSDSAPGPEASGTDAAVPCESTVVPTAVATENANCATDNAS